MKSSIKLRDKIISIMLVVVILGNFIFSNRVQAKSFLEAAGGTLLEYITEFIVFLDDTVLNTLQKNLMFDQDVVVAATSKDEAEGISLGTILVGVGAVLAVVGGIAFACTGIGAVIEGVVAIGAASGAAATAVAVGTVAGGVWTVTKGVAAAAAIGGGLGYWTINEAADEITGTIDLPMITYTPYAIFSNSIPIFDINFFSPGEYEISEENEAFTYITESSASILQPYISSWYLALRNLAIVALLSILVYVGIRMIVSSVSNDKAKYKQMLFDWLVAMCLVISMHYIMIFIVNISKNISNLFSSACVENIIIELPKDIKINGETLPADESVGRPVWITNLMGVMRYEAGLQKDINAMDSLGYVIIYTVLIIYTIIFTIIYLKRVLYMAFLTVIAPLVAITYPLDKINDGKAQAFNMWFREYTFNALLQPLHLFIYTILMGSVMTLCQQHPVYALVALGFMIPAEKMIRSMFGFEKASSPAAMGAMGAATTGLLMSGIHKLMHKPKRRDGNIDESNEKDNKIRMKGDKFDTLGTYASENSDEQENNFPSTNEDNNQTDYERENAFRNYREQGLSQEEALERLNQEKSSSVRADYQNNVGLPGYRQVLRNNPQTTKPKRTIKNRLGNGMMAVGTRYQNRLRKSHPLRTIRRGVTYGMGAATLGLIGLSAGIASGDLGNAGKYTLAAGAVGGSIGKGIGNKIASEGNQNIEAFKQGWYGNEYEDILREKKIKELQTNPNNVQYLRARDDNYREILKDAYPEYARNGCYDIEDFYAAYQLEKAGASRNSAIATYKLAQRTGDITSSPDVESKWRKRLGIEFANTEDVNRICEAEYRQIEEQYKAEEARIEEEYEKQYRQIMYNSNKSDEYRKIEEQQRIEEDQLNKEYEKQYNKVLKNAELEQEAKIRELESQYKSKIDGITDKYQKKTIAKEYEEKKRKITIENTNERKKKHQELDEKFKLRTDKLADKYKKQIENIELEPIEKEKITVLKEKKGVKFKELQEKRKEQEETIKEIPIRFSESALEDVKKFYNNKE